MSNLLESGQILYISSVDISIGNGPGVNEREFILSMYNLIGKRAHFLIPQPANKIEDLPIEQCTFCSPHKYHNPRYFLSHVISQIKLANKLLETRHFDLLVFRLDLMPLAPLYITQKHRIPYAIKTLGQGLMNVIQEKIKWFGNPLSQVNLLLVKKLVQNAIATDCVSKIHVQYLQETLAVEPNKIVWIDNSVNTNRFFPTSTNEARRELGFTQYHPIIGYVGNLPHERGGTQLIKAASLLLSKYSNLGVVILGDGKGVEELRNLAEELGVTKHCIFTGYVPFDRVPIYVNALDIGVSILLPKSYAASEQKVRQYLACGKIVIASTPGSNDFLAPENLGSLVKQDDINSIVNELDRWLCLTEEERMEFSNRAFQYACKHLSVEKSTVDRLEIWNARLNQQIALEGVKYENTIQYP
ncbi:group 1 glycosyl transferase [Calothrix sp. NIES-2100]|uniref:glycosyltransferase family 4 protein n=1 Tax=Calothrix sp. NIES-2100 TaxID=1954172 RepID=UPI000B619F3D|nr:group 1 glycosyl transferase [Calothrix sp. NIES-2100]